jgi:hypothetical protein
MKKLVSIAFLLALQIASAQEITRNTGDFTTVKVFDKITLKLVKANENKLVISGSRAEDVEVVTKNNELKIRMKLTKLLQGEDINATLYYKTITGVEANEGAFVSSEDTFKTASFVLNAKEGSNIKLELDTQNLKTKMHSGAKIELSGKALNHDVTITSGGILKAKGLVTSNTIIGISAGGEADITATENVDAKTRAGGTIDIYGKPKQVNKKTTAGGTIELRG